MNNREREQWIDNDEGLYNWWRRSRLSKRAFIKENREYIDQAIENVTGGKKPAHYMAYEFDPGRLSGLSKKKRSGRKRSGRRSRRK